MSGLDTHLKPEPWYRRRWVHITAITAAVIAVLAIVGGNIQLRVPPGPEFAERMMVPLQEARAEQGLDELVWSSCLVDEALVAADGYSQELNISVSLDSTECSGLTFTGELVSRGSTRPEDVIERWLGLQRWSELLLDEDATHIGIGCYSGGGIATCSVVLAERQ